MTAPFGVTVLVPALNEEADIAGCVDAVAAQEYPLARIQLIVVDAVSDDRTCAVVREAAARYGFGDVLVLSNPARRTSIGLNVGLREARGALLARVDARSRIHPEYLRTCEATLAVRPEVGVVGGAQVARARRDRHVDAGIAQALRNRWATGLSRYRRSRASGPSDTVWMGFFRTEQLRSLGGWAEEIALNEDWDLNDRYAAAGFVVWFDASLRSDYLPRGSFKGLARQYFRFGRVKGRLWAGGQRPAPRQIALVAAPAAFAAVLAWVARRRGPLVAALAPLLLVAVERAGHTDRVGEPDSPLMAATAIAVFSGAWWFGVVTGFLGALAHRKSERG